MEEMQNEMVKKPKKKSGKKVVIIVIIVSILCIVAVISGISAISAMNAKMQEQMSAMMGEDGDDLYTVDKQDLKQEITTSGTIIGEDVEAYTSPVTAKVDSICVEVGQIVEKGDVLLTYDASDLGDNLEKVKIQARSERAAGNASFEEANKAANRAYKANSKADELEADIKALKKEIGKLQKIVNKYEKKIKNAADKASEVTTEAKTEAASDEASSEEGKTEEATTEAPKPVAKDPLTTAERKEYNKAVSDIQKKTEAIQEKQVELEKQKSIAESNEDVTVSESTKAQVSAANELSDMNVNEAQESYDAASAGIVAAKKGIVQSIEALKGAYASEGGTLFTIIDAKKIGVEFVISKDDLSSVHEGQKVRVVVGSNEYQGTVDFISRVATMDTTGLNNSGQIKGRISIDNPDDNMFIGVSAKVYIFVGESNAALSIPYEALCSDIDGDFVYVVNSENLIERKDVKIGICSDEYYEVLEGITEGDKVIRSITKGMKPGDIYSPTPSSPMIPGM